MTHSPSISEPASSQDLRIAWPAPPDQFNFDLPTHEAHLWAFALDCKPTELATFTSLLNPEELARADRYHFSRDRNRFISGRAQLRCLLARYLRTSPQKVDFAYNPRGKPALAQGHRSPRLHFNLAHCEGLAVLAAAHSDCGIDLEQVRTVPDQDELVRRFFSHSERVSFLQLPSGARAVAFFNLWTRKEAWLKAVGQGIACGLDQVEVSFLPGQPVRLLRLPATILGRSAWTLETFEPASRFVGAVALSEAPRTMLRFHFSK